MSRQPRNKLEQSVDLQLKKLKGWKVDYELDKIAYTLVRKYVPDWTVQRADGRTVFVETKGYFDGPARSKMAAVRRDNPTLDICLVFQDASKKIRKGSEFTYADWAKKHGFKWSDKGKIKKEWFKR